MDVQVLGLMSESTETMEGICSYLCALWYDQMDTLVKNPATPVKVSF